MLVAEKFMVWNTEVRTFLICFSAEKDNSPLTHHKFDNNI